MTFAGSWLRPTGRRSRCGQPHLDALDGASELSKLFNDAVGHLHEQRFTVGAGSGSNEPEGIITGIDGGSGEVGPATGETFAAADVFTTQ